jgi:hypothetical protein
MWHKIANRLAERYTVIIPDLRGMSCHDSSTLHYDQSPPLDSIYDSVYRREWKWDGRRAGAGNDMTICADGRIWEIVQTTRIEISHRILEKGNGGRYGQCHVRTIFSIYLISLV